ELPELLPPQPLPPRGRGRPRWRRVKKSSSRHFDHEPAAAAGAALAANAATVTSSDLLDEGQAEADAAGLLGMAGQPKERLEDALAHRLGNARPAIADLERDEVAAAHADVAEADLDVAAAIALRVLEQIADGAAQQPL